MKEEGRNGQQMNGIPSKDSENDERYLSKWGKTGNENILNREF